jgi:hypothetical protein
MMSGNVAAEDEDGGDGGVCKYFTQTWRGSVWWMQKGVDREGPKWVIFRGGER